MNLNSKKLNTVIISILSVIIILLLFIYLKYPVFGYDSGFYLSVIREMKAGSIFFKDIAISYNPLAISIIGIPYFLFGLTNYLAFFTINLLAIFLSTLLLFKILKQLKVELVINYIFSLIFLTLCLYYDGAHILLEPIAVLFQLTALYNYLNYKNSGNQIQLLLSGLFISLAFLSKQYALFLLLPLGVDILVNTREKIKNIILLSIGLLVPIAILFIYYHKQEIDIITFIKYILAQGVNLDVGTGTGIKSNFNFSSLFKLIFLNSYLLIIPFILRAKKFNKTNISRNLIYILLPLASMSVFLFANYSHYYQFVIPYLIILTAYLSTKIKDIQKEKYFYIFIFMALIKIGFSIKTTIKYQYKNYNIQQKEIPIIKKEIPKNAEVFLSGLSPAYYYIANLKSIQLNQFGFCFPGYFYPETVVNTMKSGSYLVLNKTYLNEYQILLPQFKLKKKLILEDSEVYIYIKN